jgi:hypothetical protein
VIFFGSRDMLFLLFGFSMVYTDFMRRLVLVLSKVVKHIHDLGVQREGRYCIPHRVLAV